MTNLRSEDDMRLERLLKYVGETTEMYVSSLMPLSGNFDCRISKSGIYKRDTRKSTRVLHAYIVL